jgi:hypothetical protein
MERLQPNVFMLIDETKMQVLEGVLLEHTLPYSAIQLYGGKKTLLISAMIIDAMDILYSDKGWILHRFQ